MGEEQQYLVKLAKEIFSAVVEEIASGNTKRLEDIHYVATSKDFVL